MKGDILDENRLGRCEVPTLYFIGVTTKQSSIMKVFPKWSDAMGLGAAIVGYDAPIHASPDVYRQIVQHIKDDPLAMGALVTTHKIDLYNAAYDLFDELDSYAQLCGEISCISMRGNKLIGHAKDPITSRLAMEDFISSDYWAKSNGEVLCLGAGGAAIAISVVMAERTDPPRKITFVDIAQERLNNMKFIHSKLDEHNIEFDYVLNTSPQKNDELLASLSAGSLVINATGMGKDITGSPITGSGVFPQGGIAWELNYRGERDFLKQAYAQQNERNLQVVDGWVYFLHGWTQIIAEVFHIDISPTLFQQLGDAALPLRPK